MTSTDPVRVTMVTAPACHFCNDARATLTELARVYPLQVRLVAAESTDGQALLHACGAGMFPLVLVDGAFFSAGRLPRRKLTRLLARKGPAGVGGELAMGDLLASGSVLAAFFAGGVALFAPCCIVFLAPGYLALAARNHRWRSSSSMPPTCARQASPSCRS